MSGVGSKTDPRIGLEIGDYVVTEMVAAGGMGAVYKATHPPSGLLKIVKFMLAEFVANPQVRDRFARECRAAVRLKGHSNIVDIDSYGERGGEMYLVMEHLRGETLEQHLRRCGPISKQHAFRLIAQIVNALHALHEAGIVHRDLKPANVFIVPTDQEAYRVKLIDFGIVHDRTAVVAGAQMTKLGALIGTPGYMALEQFGNAANVTPAADVFALGVIVWEMFTGELPWSAPNEFALYESQKSESPVLPAGHRLPNGWEPILRLALSPNPMQRPALHTLLYALAREIAPEPPIMSGFEMVMRYAPKVLQNTPVEVETVRAVDAHRAAGAYWAMQRSTAPGTGPSTPNTPWFSVDHIPLTDPSASVPHSATTVIARPVIATPPHLTTLSSASGTSTAPSVGAETRSPRNRLAIALGVVGALGLLTFGVAMGLARRGSHESQPANASVAQPAAEPVRGASERTVDRDAALMSNNAIPIDAGIAALSDASIAPDAASGTVITKAPPPKTPTTAKKPPRTGTARGSAPVERGTTTSRGSSAAIDPDNVAE